MSRRSATDGERRVVAGPAMTRALSRRISASGCAACSAASARVAEVEAELTRLHAEAVARVSRAAIRRSAVDLIGFHGQTILHRPDERRTWQIGDGALLARLTGIDVVADFRSADVAAGGAGRAAGAAVPRRAGRRAGKAARGAQHRRRRQRDLDRRPAADEILAFDTGPGNALIDDWVRRHTGQAADFDGALALRRPGLGRACRALSGSIRISRARRRNRSTATISAMSRRRACRLADGAATLTEMTAAAVAARGAAFPGAAARMAGLRRRPAQPGDHGGTGPPARHWELLRLPNTPTPTLPCKRGRE